MIKDINQQQQRSIITGFDDLPEKRKKRQEDYLKNCPARLDPHTFSASLGRDYVSSAVILLETSCATALQSAFEVIFEY